jgi:hypothetical protein
MKNSGKLFKINKNTEEIESFSKHFKFSFSRKKGNLVLKWIEGTIRTNYTRENNLSSLLNGDIKTKDSFVSSFISDSNSSVSFHNKL